MAYNSIMSSKILVFIEIDEIDVGHFMSNVTCLILLPDNYFKKSR